MKIALCFYGQPRFFDSNEITTFLRDIRAEDVQVDVFMHLWKPENPNNITRSQWSNIDELSAKINVTDLEKKIREIYQPVSLEIEDERTFVSDITKYSRTPAPTSPEIVHRMYYSQFKVSEQLKNSGNNYDLVFRMRTDSAVLGIKKIDSYVNNQIWVPDNCPVIGWFNDNFSISSQEDFHKLCDTFNNLDDFYQKGIDMNGEPMLKAQVRKEGIEEKIRRNRFVNVGLVRGTNPLKLQGIWANDEFHQLIKLGGQNP